MEFRAPLSGLTVPLERVPDPVFAQKMAGDGLAIDPTSTEVVAPCAGVVSHLHPSKHAITVTTAEGLEVLTHVGLDTVLLQGRGFEALVPIGATVQAGQALVRFDADRIARTARSLITVVLVTNLEQRVLRPLAPRLVRAGNDVLFQVEGQGATQEVSAGPSVRSKPIRLPNVTGLHARPAAVLAQRARAFQSEVLLWKSERSANLKSMTSVMALATRAGDELIIEARGPDAAAAVRALSETLASGSGEAPVPSAKKVPPAPERNTPPPERSDVIRGLPAAPGLGLGRVTHVRAMTFTVPEPGQGIDRETAALEDALRSADQALAALGDSPILGVQRALLEDPELRDRTRGPLAAGKRAAWAWQQAYLAQAKTFESLDEPLLRERATDVRDVGQRVLGLLVGAAATKLELPDDAVLVTAELTPSQLASLDASRLRAVVTTTGSATSHVAILTRGLGIPTVMGADAAALAVPEGTTVVVDGDEGSMREAPADTRALEARLRAQQLRRDEERRAAHQPGRTRDGHRVEVVANVETAADAQRAIENGAEGVGLLRSEFLFLDRDEAPDEAEQTAAYRAVAEAVGRDRPLVIRTLDVGGDKPLRYLPLGKEENPFLGVRGVRVSLARPDLFRTQLRAIVRSADATQLHVMFPMVATLSELRAARAALAEVRSHATGPVLVGLMIEVPSAVWMAEQLAREADFFSIGTNDLTQYVLAMDRGNPQLARQADGLEPAVLRAIAATVEGARAHQRPVAVCGGLASDPLAAPVLVGLGVTELSVSVPAIGAVKAALARHSLAECEALASKALSFTSAAEVRALLKGTAP